MGFERTQKTAKKPHGAGQGSNKSGNKPATSPTDTPPSMPPAASPNAQPIDDALATIIEAWPTLPEPIRMGIAAMVKAASQ